MLDLEDKDGLHIDTSKLPSAYETTSAEDLNNAIDQAIEEKKEEEKKAEEKATDEKPVTTSPITEPTEAPVTKKTTLKPVELSIDEITKDSASKYINDVNKAIIELYTGIARTALKLMLENPNVKDTKLRTSIEIASNNENLSIDEWKDLLSKYLYEIDAEFDDSISTLFKGLDNQVTFYITEFKTKANNIYTELKSKYGNSTNENENKIISYCKDNEIDYSEPDLHNISTEIKDQLTELQEIKDCIDMCGVSDKFTSQQMLIMLYNSEQPYIAIEDVQTQLPDIEKQYDEMYNKLVEFVKHREEINARKKEVEQLIKVLETDLIQLQEHTDYMSKPVDGYKGEVTSKFTELMEMLKLPEYELLLGTANKDKIMKDKEEILRLSNKFETEAPALQTAYANFIANCNSIISEFKSANYEDKDIVAKCENKVNDFHASICEKECKYEASKSDYDNATSLVIDFTTLTSAFFDSADEFLQNLISELRQGILCEIDCINEMIVKINMIEKTLNRTGIAEIKNSQHEYEPNIQSSINLLKDEFDKIVNDRLYYIQTNTGEGSEYDKFKEFNSRCDKDIKNAERLEIQLVKEYKAEADAFNDNYIQFLKNYATRIKNFNSSVDLTLCKMHKQDENEKELAEIDKYNNDIRDNVLKLTSACENINGRVALINETIKTRDKYKNMINDVTSDPSYDKLREINNSKPSFFNYGENNINALRQAADANAKFDADYTTFIAASKTFKSTAERYIAEINDLINKTKIEKEIVVNPCEEQSKLTEKRLDISKCITPSEIALYMTNNIDTITELCKKINELCMSKDYIEQELHFEENIAIAYDKALTNPDYSNVFQDYLTKRAQNIESDFDKYKSIIQTYKQQSNDFMNHANVSYAILETYYDEIAPIYNDGFIGKNNLDRSVLPNYGDFKDAWVTYYNGCKDSYDKVKDILSGSSEANKSYTSALSNMAKIWEKIKQEWNIGKQNNEIIGSKVTDLAKLENTFDVTYANLSMAPEALSSSLMTLLSLARTTFEGCTNAISAMNNAEAKVSEETTAAGKCIGEFWDQLVVLRKAADLMDSKYAGNINNLRAYYKAATIISYLYCAAWIGRGRTTITVNKEEVEYEKYIRSRMLELLSMDNDENSLLVFEKLCAYSPLLPLLWPNGDSQEERACFNNTDKTMTSIDKNALNKYVHNQLVTYLTNAMIGTNVTGITNSAIEHAQLELTKRLSDDPEAAAKERLNIIDQYCDQYLEKVSECDNDTDFVKITYEMMDTGPIHLWNRILAFLSKKKYRNINEVPVPTNYPLIDTTFEKQLATVILLNRFFNYLGKPTYYVINETTSSITGKPVELSTWTDLYLKQWGNDPIVIKSVDDCKSKESVLNTISKSMSLGGMCLQYTDTSKFESMYYLTSKQLENKGPYTLNNMQLKVISDGAADTARGAFLQSLFPCAVTDTVNDEGTSAKCIRFRNPTSCCDFMFKTQDANKWGFEGASIDNYRHENWYTEAQKQTRWEALISEIMDKSGALFEGSDFQNAFNFAFNYDYPEAIFAYIRDTALNWTFRIPIIDYTTKKINANGVNVYPLAKVNAITYNINALNKQLPTGYYFYDMFK